MKTITAIISSFRRPENIPIMIERIKQQTYPAKRIIVWNNVCTDDGKVLKFDDDSIEVINTNSNNWSLSGSFSAGYLTKSDFIAQMDDDHPPGPRWFEYCVKKQEDTPGIYVRRGVILLHNDRYRPNNRFGSRVGNGELKIADMGGGCSFMPKKAINCFLFETPPTYHSTTDIHLAYTTQKYGNFKVYVPFPEEEEMLPKYKENELPLGDGDRAMWQQPGHFMVRDGAIRYYVKRGWKLINFR